MSKPIVVVVSGALVTKQNRGIGEAICRGVLSLSQPVILYAASRAGKDLQFNPNAATGSQVKYPKLDITDKESIERLVAEIQESENGVDALINNAGVNVDQQYSLENVKLTLATNYEGTLRMNSAFLPLIRSRKGRIVNLSSIGSMLKPYSPEIQERFRSVQSLEDVDRLRQEYVENVKNRTETESGWGGQRRAYSVSKALINGLTRVLARHEEKRGSGMGEH
ncbi:hypothetical protein QFC21_003950 [Naganishia friedmannii]|uniref:Uncharacterized protein n=1 Tax=Naganishia friedmannii TaxID=89922 RepID=A0ACC2VLR4_9TREE|nr:hypothetical protein QFC21_003950 [Naganishia friedmannii]